MWETTNNIILSKGEWMRKDSEYDDLNEEQKGAIESNVAAKFSMSNIKLNFKVSASYHYFLATLFH